jgi:Hypoxia induced protein conserved region
MNAALLKRPSGFMPLAMSAFALALVIGYVAMFGTEPQEDEGTAAHLFQLTMAAQVLVIAYFTLRWLPTAPRQGVVVLAIQILAAGTAMFPIWWFGW